MQKPWQLNRRSFLRGTGVAVALPMLDAMQPLLSTSSKPTSPPEAIRRMCYVYFPNGASMPKEH
ncbi:MAG: hypothetical protein ACI89X_004751, partial [Planctomycetota bacterium]